MITLSSSKQEFYDTLKNAKAPQEILDWINNLNVSNVEQIIIKSMKNHNTKKYWFRFILNHLDLDEVVMKNFAGFIKDEPVSLYKIYKKNKSKISDKIWWEYHIKKGNLAITKGKL